MIRFLTILLLSRFIYRYITNVLTAGSPADKVTEMKRKIKLIRLMVMSFIKQKERLQKQSEEAAKKLKDDVKRVRDKLQICYDKVRRRCCC